MRQNKIIAVTGGIGSGKSTALEIIKEKGYKVFSCDKIYADLTRDKNFLEGLCILFGNVLNGEGELDRKKLSEIVFSDKNKLDKLDAYTHPAIYKEMFRRAESVNQTCFCEVPLLFESGAEGLFDKVVVVVRPEKDRMQSAAVRDNVSEETIKKRIDSQFDYDNADFTKYYVIHNTGNINDLRVEVEDLLDKIQNL